jgi:hypothetical protein
MASFKIEYLETSVRTLVKSIARLSAWNTDKTHEKSGMTVDSLQHYQQAQQKTS